MTRYLINFLFAMSIILINPPSDGYPPSQGKRIQIPGRPPIIVVFPGGK